MYLELPIFAFAVEYNKATTESKAQYFANKEELLKLLSNLKESELLENAKNMKLIANEQYTWKKIARQYADLF